MSYLPVKIFTVTATSGALSSTVADLAQGWNRIYLEVPTMASGDLFLLASSDNSTFRRVMKEQANTATVHMSFTILSAVSQRMVPIPPGFQYYKVESTSGCTDVVTTYNFICSD